MLRSSTSVFVPGGGDSEAGIERDIRAYAHYRNLTAAPEDADPQKF